jgi:hypothetical protein
MKVKGRYFSFLLGAGFAALLLASAPALATVATAPPLGGAQQFGALGASAVTGQTGLGAVVSGDVGSYPTPSITNFPPSIVLAPFVLHLAADAVVQLAQTDATAASANLFGQGPPTVLVAQLGGTTQVPGVYSFASTADIATNTTLTLSGAGIYVFQVGSSITANVGSHVVFENGASPCSVFWAVTGSATLSGVNFPGTVIAGASVTVATILTGRALALSGAVTMPGGGGTTIGGCSAAPPLANGVAVTKAFLPTSIQPGGVAILTITLSNANAADAVLTSPLTDTLLGGLVIAPTPNASTTCGVGGVGGGVVSATAGGTTVSLSTNSSIPGGTPFGSCTVAVSVTAPTLGSFVNTLPAGALVATADLGDTSISNPDAASATLTGSVTAVPTLSEWAMIMLAALVVLFGVAGIRRHAM